MAGCYPADAGTYSASETTCDAGFFCPPGSKAADVQIPPGFYAAGAGHSSMNDLTPCPAGSFCDFESVVGTNACPAGHYCEEGTVF